MDAVSQALNTPVTVIFNVGGKDVELAFHELTIGEMAAYRSRLVARAQNEWQKRLKLVAATIESERERRKYFLEAAQTEPDWHPEIARLSSTEDGIKWALQAGCKPPMSDTLFNQINGNEGNADPLVVAINTCFAIKPAAPEVSADANPQNALPQNLQSL